ncbi:MAG: GxxExxY protein [Chloroflexota bacterium]
MAQRFTKHLELTEKIIGACHEVHKVLGPGLEERFYRDALARELELRGLRVRREQEFPVEYKGKILGVHRVDLIVEDKVLVELKAVTGGLLNAHVAQTVSERKVSKLEVALLFNFGDVSVQVRRLEAPEADPAASKVENRGIPPGKNPLIP